MTEEELLEDVRNSYLKFCNKIPYCDKCPYDNRCYLDCEIVFTISYLNKRHLIKGLESEE